MKFILLLIATISTSANAETWIKYEQSTKSGFTAYYSADSIKAEGNFRSVLVLKNYELPKTFDAEKPYFEYRSTVSTQLINCSKNSYKNNKIQIWTELNGKGVLRKDYDYNKKENWDNVKKGSIQEALHDKVCFKILGKK
jgi:hypothetical protein